MHVSSSSDEEGGQGPSAALSNSVRMVVDALAGALSGCVARVVVGPLDVIKIRFQVQQGEPLHAAHQRACFAVSARHQSPMGTAASMTSSMQQWQSGEYRMLLQALFKPWSHMVNACRSN